MYGDNQNNNGKKELGDILFGWKRNFDNFMYHYKFLALAVIGIAAIVIFALAQCVSRTTPDADIAYAGTRVFDVYEMNNMQAAFNEILGEDLTGDGNIRTNFVYYRFMTDTQIEQAVARGEIVDISAIRIVRTQLALEVIAANNIIYFMSPEAYRATRRVNNINSFMFIDHALGYKPPEHILYDEFAIRLNELPCYYYFEGINAFPEDTLLAIRDLRGDDDTQALEKHERNLIMFRRIAGFDYEQE
jgi:hypothetical protein